MNTIKTLSLIRSSELISRAELVKECGLSAPTVSRIVENLIEGGLVRETGAGKSSGGRRPTLLEFSGHDNCIIGIDLGTTQILGVLSDLNANIISEVSRPTHVKEGFHKVMLRTSNVISELQGQLNGISQRICGVGMAVAGDILFDKVRKTVNARALKKIAKDIQIVPATFGNKASVMGAVSLIASEVFSLERNNCVFLNNQNTRP